MYTYRRRVFIGFAVAALFALVAALPVRADDIPTLRNIRISGSRAQMTNPGDANGLGRVFEVERGSRVQYRWDANGAMRLRWLAPAHGISAWANLSVAQSLETDIVRVPAGTYRTTILACSKPVGFDSVNPDNCPTGFFSAGDVYLIVKESAAGVSVPEETAGPVTIADLRVSVPDPVRGGMRIAQVQNDTSVIPRGARVMYNWNAENAVRYRWRAPAHGIADWGNISIAGAQEFIPASTVTANGDVQILACGTPVGVGATASDPGNCPQRIAERRGDNFAITSISIKIQEAVVPRANVPPPATSVASTELVGNFRVENAGRTFFTGSVTAGTDITYRWDIVQPNRVARYRGQIASGPGTVSWSDLNIPVSQNWFVVHLPDNVRLTNGTPYVVQLLACTAAGSGTCPTGSFQEPFPEVSYEVIAPAGQPTSRPATPPEALRPNLIQNLRVTDENGNRIHQTNPATAGQTIIYQWDVTQEALRAGLQGYRAHVQSGPRTTDWFDLGITGTQTTLRAPAPDTAGNYVIELLACTQPNRNNTPCPEGEYDIETVYFNVRQPTSRLQSEGGLFGAIFSSALSPFAAVFEAFR